MVVSPWTQVADGVVLDVRVTARSGRDAQTLDAVLEGLTKVAAKVTS
jgi:hypothetical protein